MMNNEKFDTLTLLNKLIKTRSDSATAYEKHFEKCIVNEIESIPYFTKNPKQFGLSMIPNDNLKRNVIWALSDNKAAKTVILFGHHDTAEPKSYGSLDALKTNVPGEEFEGEWLFGRGSCDMKAGLAINLSSLKKATGVSPGVNVLFLSVPDEKTHSAGMRHAVTLLKALKQEFLLNYELAILTEPHEREQINQFNISSGSVGKMMPVIVTKGIPTHSSNLYSGLNAISITMEIIKAIELNIEMGDTINKKMTPPPAFINMYAIRDTIDVTTPEYTVAYFNWLFLKGNLTGKFDQLKELCKWSVEDAINQFNYSYNEFLRKQAMPSYKECVDFEFEILFFNELVSRASLSVDVEEIANELRLKTPDISSENFTVLYIKELMGILESPYPIVVIGLLPPFYPVVDSGKYFEETLKMPLTESLMKQGLVLKQDSYYMGTSDMSYIKKMKHDSNQILVNMPLYNHDYKIDFDGIAQLDISVVHIGPWGKDLHQKTERVFIKDVIETVPKLIDAVFEAISK